MTIPIGLRTTSSAGISSRNEQRIETDQDSRATPSAPRIRTQVERRRRAARLRGLRQDAYGDVFYL